MNTITIGEFSVWARRADDDVDLAMGEYCFEAAPMNLYLSSEPLFIFSGLFCWSQWKDIEKKRKYGKGSGRKGEYLLEKKYS